MDWGGDPRLRYIRATAEVALDADGDLFDALIADEGSRAQLGAFLEGGVPALLLCLHDLPPPAPPPDAGHASDAAAGDGAAPPTGEPADTREDDQQPQDGGEQATADPEKQRPFSGEPPPRAASSDALQAAAEADQATAGAEGSSSGRADSGGENGGSGAAVAPEGSPEQQQQQQQQQQAAEPAGAPPQGPKQELLLFLGNVPEALDGCRTFFCLHSTGNPVPMERPEEHLQCGVLASGPTLHSLEQLLVDVYLPLLVQHADDARSAGTGASTTAMAVAAALSGGGGGSGRELLAALQKYIGQVEQTLTHLQGDVALRIPEVRIPSVAAAAADPDALEVLEAAAAGWSESLAALMQAEGEKKPVGKGPMAEVEFWRARSAVLSGVSEQLALPRVRDMLAVLDAGSEDRQLLAALRAQIGELEKLATEARDNVKFLSTLERHFKTISSGPLAAVADCLLPLMSALRMVWIMSRHYGDDERMGALLSRIGREIGDRVEGAVSLGELFCMPAADAGALLRTSRTLLEQWHSTYMQVRERIELSGRDARWEFPKGPLFGRTNYMAEICGALAEMVEVVDDFFKFLGPELKAVTGDTKGIDDVIERVQLMLEPVETAMFNVFDAAHAAQWRALRARFYTDNEEVKAATRELIDTSFRKLRSAEGAFELLSNFKSIESRGAIQQQMMNKLVDILEQFHREVGAAQEAFDRHKGSPPITRNMPPVAGTIRWIRLLFSRVKQTMAKLQAAEPDGSWTEHAIGQQVYDGYLALARCAMEFEKSTFAAWRERADAVAMAHLKQPILCKDPETGAVSVNFHPELRTIMLEARYLDRQRFEIPPIALQVALQWDEYRRWIEALEGLLVKYYKAIAAPSPAERDLLSARLAALARALEPGLSRLNWNSRGIDDFVARAGAAVHDFQGLFNQVSKNASILDKAVTAIAAAQLVADPPTGTDLPELQEYYERMEQARAAAVEVAVKKYRSLTPILCKVEELVAGTNNGRSPQLSGYYAFWEMAVFNALALMLLRALERLHAAYGPAARQPLFRVKTSLQSAEVVVQPPVKETTKLLTSYVKNVAESCREFVRWMDGACVEMPDQRPPGETEGDPLVLNFSPEVLRIQQVMAAAVQVHQDVTKCGQRITRHLEAWRRWSEIWKSDKAALLDKFKAKAPGAAVFEEKFSKFKKQAEYFWEQARDVDIGFARVSGAALALSVHEECLQWSRALAAAMRELDEAAAAGLRARIAAVAEALDKDPATLDELKELLAVVAAVRSEGMMVELRCGDLEERYRMRLIYAIGDAAAAQCRAELEDACRIAGEWAALAERAERRDAELEGVKRRFSETTRQQVSEFAAGTQELAGRLKAAGPGAPSAALPAGLDLLQAFQKEVAALSARREALQLAEQLFDMPVTPYPALADAEAELRRLGAVFGVYSKYLDAVRSYSGQLWSELDVGRMVDGMQEIATRLSRLRGVRDLPVYGRVEAEITGFLDSLPLMRQLKSDALRPRHWRALMAATGREFEMDPRTFTLGNMFSMQLHKFGDEVAKITASAAKELVIETELKKLADLWREQRFTLHKYTNNGVDRGWVLKGVDDVLLLLEDLGLNLQSMMASPYVRPFAEDVRQWEQKLSLISEAIEVWMVVQRRWMYLESIFTGSDDIRQQLPAEATRFDTIDRGWGSIMADTAKNTLVLDACSADGRLDQLRALSEQLELCQKSLSDYLDTKRAAFPRFYFISDEELLAVLGTSDPTSVQEHMLKLFDNAAALKFGRGNKSVVGMTSSEGESFAFRSAVAVDGPVEAWMTGVEAEMRATLAAVMKEGVWAYAKTSRPRWIQDSLGMVTLAGSQVWWTWETEDALRRAGSGADKRAVKDYAAKLTGQLAELTGMVRGELSPEARRKVNTLVITDVHGRDIVDAFVRDSVVDAREFAWESQLRFYWDRGLDDLTIRQCTGLFRFGYEYMGLNGRLVITALTDRCYMTLTTALTYRLGGAPAGPAGTGKTETVKDLAKSLAVLCVVFNCGEGLDYKAMGSIFSGLVQCGAWGCFDEFNRIDAEVLSVVSSQIRTIQEALKNDARRFQFEGREIRLDARTGIFITMNPGYAGRTELPDNLKALFRPVTMVVPDMEQICEIMLFSEGFDTAKVLAKKMTVLYKLAAEQLSKQHHYDFGLRALKSVLVMAGALKRGSPGMSEQLVLMRALRDMNLPKFVYDDVPLFLGLVGDLFPGLDCPRVRYPRLNDEVEAELAAAGYQVITSPGGQVDKVVQLYEVMLTRHTTMVVGQTGGGKSVILQALARAQGRLGRKTTLSILNPKAITVAELYGVLDKDTRDWTDGLLSNIFRELNKPLPPDRDEARYIVFDGDVDAVWVENMNSVMDDNRLLTLPNGERIRLANHVKLLFEVADLQYASPATISRCGMVFVDSRNLGWRPFLWRWLNTRPAPAEAEALRPLFERYAAPAIAWVTEGVDGDEIVKRPLQAVPQTGLNLLAQLCGLLDATLSEATGGGDEAGSGGSGGDEVKLLEPQALEGLFIFCCTWSIGGTLVQRPEAKERGRFDALMRRLSGMPSAEGESVPPGSLPARPLYEFYFDARAAEWRSWGSQVGPYVPPPDGAFAKILVPTVDIVRSTWLLKTIAGAGRPCLFVGDSGTAKSVTVAAFLAGLDAAAFTSCALGFSSRTSSADVQRAIEDCVEKRTKDTYGPPLGKRLVLFVDDLNMPRLDSYGTQQPIALLRQVVERRGMYDRGKELSWKNLKDVQVLGAMGPPGGARNAVDPRFISLFSVFEIETPSADSLRAIFQTILGGHLATMPEAVRAALGNGASLTDATLELLSTVLERLPPTPSRFHYVFNLRDLSRLYEGLLRATPQSFPDAASVLRLWRNEALRVFRDRMVTPEDRAVVDAAIQRLLAARWPEAAPAALAEPLLFGDYRGPAAAVRLADDARAGGEGDAGSEPQTPAASGDGAAAKPAPEPPRRYEDVGDYAAVKPLFERLLAAYNQKVAKKMGLVFFEDALEHLTRICRTISLPRGNCLLVGVGGSGKSSLARLAAFTIGAQVFEITLTRGYDEAAFRDDLKRLYTLLGAEDRRVVFLFTDSHVADESFLELINNILTRGIVPALFDDAEKDGLASGVRDAVIAAGLDDSREGLWNFFVDRCRANLHVVLAMSPVGEALRTRCRNFPGLVNNTVIDWFEPWPEQALESVASVFLAADDLPGALRPGIVAHMVGVHQSVRRFSARFEAQLRRHNYVTPKNYLDYISTYRRLLSTQRRSNEEMAARLTGGLSKLEQAATEVDALQKELSQARVVVKAATEECNQLLEVIASNTADAESRQKAAQEKEESLKGLSAQIEVEKAEAEQALSEAIPALEEAAAALNDLKRDDITEIRSFAKPHILVQKVCECVVILRNLKDVSWGGAKSMMADPYFLKSLLEFDKDGLNDKQVKRVKGDYMKDPAFTLENIKTISTAGAGLLKWVFAMVNYFGVAKGVEPKRKKVAEAERNLRTAQRDLADTKERLAELNRQLAGLRDQFAAKTAEQLDLKAKAEVMERRLNAAERLIAGLGSERARWGGDVARLLDARVRLVGDCLLCASFLSYCGAFTFDYRQAMLRDTWAPDAAARGIPATLPLSLPALLTTDVEVAQWASEGLPGDELSVQNGLLTTRANRWPLCIDPQMQAVRWIKAREGRALEGKVKTFGDADFLKQLELAVTYGGAFLFEGCDEYIDPVIDPVLEKALTPGPGGKQTIRLGDKDVDWDPNFRLYLTTKLANPHYGPEVAGKTSIINYAVTQDGLAAQLLGVVVAHERPDLEAARVELIAAMGADKALLSRLEDTLLRELSSATGNILDNAELLSTLEGAKSKAVELAARLDTARATASEIDDARVRYSPVAARGAGLFFCMAALSALNPMYEYSLASFLGVFNGSLRASKKEPALEARLRALTEQLTSDAYAYVCTGLFEAHKLLFSFSLAVKVLEGGPRALDPQLLDFFLKGNLSLERAARERPHEWLPDPGWQDVMGLTQLAASKIGPDGAPHPLASLADAIASDGASWRDWFELEAPEAAPPPGALGASLTTFERLLPLRCLRVDRVTVGVTRWVIGELGERYVTPPVLDYSALYRASSETAPVVFVLSPGADPVFDVFRLGEELGYRPGGKLKYMALGQGMGPKAAELIETGAARGLWVMLQNCHLLPRWLKTMEKILDRLAKPHRDFRLWLTTEPCEAFPLGVLQRSLKVVTEPPNGLKLNLRQSYGKITDELLDDCPHPAFRSLVYVLGFFHAVVQERRKYGKLGWNVPYDFSETDFRISLALTSTYLTKAALAAGSGSGGGGGGGGGGGVQQQLGEGGGVPWGTLRYLVGEAMYGGRVSDSYDRRVLTTYLEEYMGDFLFGGAAPFRFYAPRGPGGGEPVGVPAPGRREAYIDAIEALPLVQSPELFGLHANADISYYSAAAKALWAGLIDLQPRSAGGGGGGGGAAAAAAGGGGGGAGGGGREELVAGVARDILARLPAQFDVPMIRKAIGVPSPTQVVLLQELERFNALAAAMSSSLQSLGRALAGEVGFSGPLEELAAALANGRLPPAWARLAPQTQKPLGAWMAWFARRHAQYAAWVEGGEPKAMWLSGLSAPETYLAALVQAACRDRGWPLDRSRLVARVTGFADESEVPERPRHGCYACGLFLEGAAWDPAARRLVRQPPGQLVQELPLLQLLPSEAGRGGADAGVSGAFAAPVYVTQARRDAMGRGLVFEAALDTDEHPSHWVLAGVALVLNVDR